MKKLLLALSVLAFVSCEKDHPNEEDQSYTVVIPDYNGLDTTKLVKSIEYSIVSKGCVLPLSVTTQTFTSQVKATNESGKYCVIYGCDTDLCGIETTLIYFGQD